MTSTIRKETTYHEQLTSVLSRMWP